VLAALLAGAVASTSLRGVFLLDDLRAIVENPAVNDSLPGEPPLFPAFSLDYWGEPAGRGPGTWRPLVVLTFVIDWQLGRGAPLPFHATNLLLHAAVAAASALLFAELAGLWTGLLAAGWIATCAASAEAYHSIVGRADLLLALFALLGLRSHRRSGEGADRWTAIWLGCALLSKESAVVLPLVWFAFDRLLPVAPSASGSDSETPSGRSLVERALLYLGTIGAVLLLRVSLFGRSLPRFDAFQNPLVAATPVRRLLGALAILWNEYLPGLLNPARRLFLCSAPACGPRGPGDLAPWLGLGVLLLVLTATFALRRRLPLASAGLVWALALFLPVSNLVLLGPTVYAERTLYAPMVGLGLALAAATAALAARARRPQLVNWLYAALLLGQAASTAARGLDWTSAERLVASGLEVEPEAAVIQLNAAVSAFRDRHDAAAALQHARRSLALAPDPRAGAILGLSLEKLGRLEEADQALRGAFESSGDDADIAADYARFLLRQGQHGQARTILARGKRSHPTSRAIAALEQRLRN
jgi:tetratricopeptide (TPR) repeat protein